MGKSTTLLIVVLALSLGYLMKAINDAGSLGEWVASVVPYVPSHWIQNAGNIGCFVLSSYLLPLAKATKLLNPIHCSETIENDQLVIVAVNKGGSILSSLFTNELIFGCGFTVSIGQKLSEDWPPEIDTLPFYDSNIYMAPGNAFNWPEYAYRINPKTNKPREVRCVVLTRDPFDRFFSLYKYSWDGGESGLRHRSKDMKSLQTHKERVDYVWSQYGKESLEVTHDVLTKSLSGDYGCIQVKVDDLFKGGESFDKGVLRMLEKWNISPDAREQLLVRFRSHDLTRQAEAKVSQNEHVSGKSISREDKATVKAIMSNDAKIMNVINQQRKELNYVYDQ